MANQAFSVANDLMVGAGKLYFKRNDDPHGLHHLGNVDEMTITTDVEKVDKNSSMNKKRELMASVVTSVSPSASLTLTEYNPYNLALGLFGTEGVHTQVATTLTNESYTVDSVPGIIRLVDADGNPYFNVTGVTVSPSTSTPASVAFTTPELNYNIVTGSNDTIEDADGNSIKVALGTASLTSATTLYMRVVTTNTTTTDVSGLVIEFQEGAAGAVETLTFGTGTTDTQTTASGFQVTATVGGSATSTFPVNASVTTPIMGSQISYTPASGGYVFGVDYFYDEQSLRAGLIKIRPNSAINEGDTVLISATVPEGNFVTVSGGDAGDIQGQLLFVGDPNIGGQYVIDGWKVKVTPDGDFTGLIGTDFGTFNLTIDFLADYENHPQYPYYRATHVGKADGTTANAGDYDPNY